MEQPPSPRRQLHGYVSTAARDGWYGFAAAHQTNVTALLEALGAVLGVHTDTPSNRLPPLLREALRDAQLIASSRSSRQRE